MNSLILVTVLCAVIVGSNAWCVDQSNGYEYYNAGEHSINGKTCTCPAGFNKKLVCGGCKFLGKMYPVGEVEISNLLCNCEESGALNCQPQLVGKRSQEDVCFIKDQWYTSGIHMIGDVSCICKTDGDFSCESEEELNKDGKMVKRMLSMLQAKKN